MPWVKLDDQFPDHPKVEHLSDGAFRLHVAALCHAGRYLTDGFISKNRPPRLMPTYRPRYLRELLEGGLWDTADGGYLIHDFTDWNKPRAWWEEKRIKDSQRLADWRSRNGVTNGVTNGVQNDESEHVRPVPVPVPGSSVVAFRSQSSPHGLTEDGLDRIRQAIGPACTKAHARKSADFVLAKAPADVRNPVNYVLAAIADDPDAYRYRRGNPTRETECPEHAGEWADACRQHALERRLGGSA